MGTLVIDGSFKLVLAADASTAEPYVLQAHITREVITQLVCEGHAVLLYYSVMHNTLRWSSGLSRAHYTPVLLFFILLANRHGR